MCAGDAGQTGAEAQAKRFHAVAIGVGRGRRQGSQNTRRHSLDPALHGLEDQEHDLSAVQYALGQIRRHPLHEIPNIGEFGKGRLDQNSALQQTSPARDIARRTKISNIKSIG